MANVYDVAKYVLKKLGSMPTMKLQKEVYYCQAWSLGWDGKPLFDEDFQAWANGPVCPELFSRHKGLFIVDESLFGSLPDYAFTQEEQETLKIRLEAELRQSVEAALARLQEWRTDCTGLGVRAALLHPSQWRRVQAEWPQRFAGLPVRVEVQVTVER